MQHTLQHHITPHKSHIAPHSTKTKFKFRDNNLTATTMPYDMFAIANDSSSGSGRLVENRKRKAKDTIDITTIDCLEEVDFVNVEPSTANALTKIAMNQQHLAGFMRIIYNKLDDITAKTGKGLSQDQSNRLKIDVTAVAKTWLDKLITTQGVMAFFEIDHVSTNLAHAHT